jgi:hypothetical protein
MSLSLSSPRRRRASGDFTGSNPTHPSLRCPTLYLVDRGTKATKLGIPGGPKHEPAILASFFYVKSFLASRAPYHYRHWVLDSGAFSAHTLNKTIDLQAYIEFCLEMMATDDKLTEIFTLDVIGGDWRDTAKNTEKMWKAGVPATPVFHVGEPWDALVGYAKDYPKVSLGGMVPVRSKKIKHRFVSQAFARVWPKPIHGLGLGSPEFLNAYPWHSCDCSTWVMAAKFGHWAAFDGARLCIRRYYNLTAEIEHFLAIEREAQSRWQKEMQQFDLLSLILPLARKRIIAETKKGN